ncbi:MAG: hypothetical protein KR126chlam2_01151, partial [Chlamydiae bacterium]|nr:hypothetical protein [Chlamydiota bacterium]
MTNRVSEFSSSTYSLIKNNVDLMTVAEVTLVALAIILLSDTLPLGMGSTLLDMGGIACCSSALVIGVKEMTQHKKTLSTALLIPPREKSNIRYIGPINSAQLLTFFKHNPLAPEPIPYDMLLQAHIPPLGYSAYT